MAKSASSKCCITCLIVVLVIILAIGITVGVVLNSTPTKLGFADKHFLYGGSYKDFGIADLKLAHILSGILHQRGLYANDNFEEKYITNPYSAEKEPQIALALFENSNIKIDNQLNCSEILSSKVVYDNKYLRTFKDTSLAFVFDRVIDSHKGVTDIRFDVKEITITNSITPHAKIALMLESEPAYLTSSAKRAMVTYLAGFTALYIDFYFRIDDAGVIAAQDKQVIINEGDIFKTTIINHLLDDKLDTFKEEVVDLFIKMTSNMGAIGNAATDANMVIEATPTYGENGVNNGSISFITYNAQ